jgi:hypothetical protein
MSLTPKTTIAEIAADEDLQRELAEIILSNGVRGAMWERHISYDSADRIAEGVHAGCGVGLERFVERAQEQAA